ncbi:DUF4349 domain-containing protein [Pseudomonas nitroreducens]|uniref:DUF4349 domain-containing protein n=1 Tax=Pseudomonas nitroreducens TaxID=46680 RepID=UPI003908BAB5
MHHWAALALTVALAGCSGPSEHGAGAGVAFQGEAAKAGAFLAYEHQVGIRLASERIDAQLAASRDACQQDRFGHCDLIAIEQSGDSQMRRAHLVVRIVPEGVEKLVALAAEGGQLQSRSTQAEDLAQAVSDNQQLRDRLQREYQTLQSFQGRKDMSVSDLLALAKATAEVEQQLHAASQDAAQQQRRIATNLLTLDFSSEYQPTGRWSRIGNAFSNSLEELTDGTVNAIQMAAFGLPILVVLLIAGLILRWLWRRLGRRRGAHKAD